MQRLTKLYPTKWKSISKNYSTADRRRISAFYPNYVETPLGRTFSATKSNQSSAMSWSKKILAKKNP